MPRRERAVSSTRKCSERLTLCAGPRRTRAHRCRARGVRFGLSIRLSIPPRSSRAGRPGSVTPRAGSRASARIRAGLRHSPLDQALNGVSIGSGAGRGSRFVVDSSALRSPSAGRASWRHALDHAQVRGFARGYGARPGPRAERCAVRFAYGRRSDSLSIQGVDSCVALAAGPDRRARTPSRTMRWSARKLIQGIAQHADEADPSATRARRPRARVRTWGCRFVAFAARSASRRAQIRDPRRVARCRAGRGFALIASTT